MMIRYGYVFAISVAGDRQLITGKNQVTAILKGNISVLKSLGVKRIGIFGSFTREEQTETSDVDLLVEFEQEEKSVDHFLDLADFLEGKLQRPVDLLTLDSLSPYLRADMLSEAQYVAVTA